MTRRPSTRSLSIVQSYSIATNQPNSTETETTAAMSKHTNPRSPEELSKLSVVFVAILLIIKLIKYIFKL